MPSVIQLRERLLKKLKQLFQLDQPDLDFGFYRIMHAKSQQVSEFIEKDLFKIVQDSFGQVDATRTVAAKAAYENAIETAKHFRIELLWYAVESKAIVCFQHKFLLKPQLFLEIFQLG